MTAAADIADPGAMLVGDMVRKVSRIMTARVTDRMVLAMSIRATPIRFIPRMAITIPMWALAGVGGLASTDAASMVVAVSVASASDGHSPLRRIRFNLDNAGRDELRSPGQRVFVRGHGDFVVNVAVHSV